MWQPSKIFRGESEFIVGKVNSSVAKVNQSKIFTNDLQFSEQKKKKMNT